MNALVGSSLHPLDLPTWLGAALRAVLFIVSVCTLGGVWAFLSFRDLPLSRRMLMFALGTEVTRSVLVQVERWDQTLYIEGLPIDFIVLALTIVGIRLWIGDR